MRSDATVGEYGAPLVCLLLQPLGSGSVYDDDDARELTAEDFRVGALFGLNDKRSTSGCSSSFLSFRRLLLAVAFYI